MSKTNRVYLLFIFFAVIYLGLILLLPPAPYALRQHQLTEDQARLLSLTLIIPYIVIWFVAFFGYVRLKSYAMLISKSRDGRFLLNIAEGLLVLAIGLPVTAIADSLIRYMARSSHHLTPVSTITSVYADIIIGVIAMSFIYKGAQGLAKMVNKQASTTPSYAVTLSMAIIGTSFIGLTLNNPARQFPISETGRAAYYLPDFLLVTTVLIPLLYVWYIGLQAAFYIESYRHQVKGVIYRDALGYLASGIMFIIIARIALRYLTSLNTIVSSLALAYLLVVLYGLLILTAIGYGLTAKGAKKLKQLEEV